MSVQSEKYLRGVPTKPYDLLREGLIVLAIVAVIVIVLAILAGSPDYPTITAGEVATKQPVAFLQLCTDYLSGNSDLQTYGPPYTNNPENAQTILGFVSPAKWFGVTIPVDAKKDFILTPLAKVAKIDPTVGSALAAFEQASASQQAAWTKNFGDALDKATTNGSQVVMPQGDYGPVETMMVGMLHLGQAGLVEGALADSSLLPYSLDNTKALLFMEGDLEENVAGQLDMQGGQWGIGHETGNYPGAWWLWPYTFLYQVPAIANSPNADLLVGLIIGAFLLILVFLPVIPILNRIPHWIKVYRIIWRDWYRNYRT
ncbi:MAG TPA: hypothetical protein VMV68_10495 [Spirochaetia bacterium]|nr:hypothetical protein [Spirochaetia bacterium]